MKIRFFGLTKSEKAAFLLDYLVIYLFTAGVMWAVYQLTGLPVSIGENLLLSLVAVFLGLFILRFWWIPPILLVLTAGGIFGYGVYHGMEELRGLSEYWGGFFNWISDGIPERIPYSENGSFYLIEIVLAVAVMLILTLLIRKLFFFPALCVIWVTIPVAFFALGNRNVTFLVCMMIACCVVSMPRFAYNCALKKSDESAFRISRSSMQILAVPIALICILLAVFMTPENDGAWKNKFLVRRLDDIQTLIDVWRGDLGVHPVFKIADFGYMPYGDKIGGDIETGSEKVMSVVTDTPFLLRGRVYNLYTKNQWKDREGNGSFRMDSLLWRGRRSTVFGFGNPTGGERAKELFDSMTTEAEYRIRYISDSLRTIFVTGRVQDVDYSNLLKMEPYFDMQGEIFTPYTIAIGDFANVKTQVLDRTLPDFDENMVELMALVSDQEDPQWEEIKSQYLQIPKKMPDRVKIMAENIVLNAENDYEKAVLLEQWLKNNCTYTKTPGDIPEGEEAVSWFLKTRQGYCTYYASAMTMMAREIGLPARYVTGFALGWVEGYDNAYYATESTAHAWCEIYFKGIGWVTFDPSGWDFSYNAETGEEFPDIEERDSSVDEEENGEFEPDPDATYDVFIDPFEEETPEEEIRHFFLPYFIIVGILAILFLIVWIRKLLLDYFLKKYELCRILKGRNHEQVMDEYYYDFLVQMRILDHPIQRGETTHHFFERMLPEMEWIRKEFIWFGELVDEVHFAGRKPSMQELERVFFFHSDVERKMLNQMKPRNYLVKRFFTKGSFS